MEQTIAYEPTFYFVANGKVVRVTRRRASSTTLEQLEGLRNYYLENNEEVDELKLLRERQEEDARRRAIKAEKRAEVEARIAAKLVKRAEKKKFLEERAALYAERCRLAQEKRDRREAAKVEKEKRRAAGEKVKASRPKKPDPTPEVIEQRKQARREAMKRYYDKKKAEEIANGRVFAPTPVRRSKVLNPAEVLAAKAAYTGPVTVRGTQMTGEFKYFIATSSFSPDSIAEAFSVKAARVTIMRRHLAKGELIIDQAKSTARVATRKDLES